MELSEAGRWTPSCLERAGCHAGGALLLEASGPLGLGLNACVGGARRLRERLRPPGRPGAAAKRGLQASLAPAGRGGSLEIEGQSMKNPWFYEFPHGFGML